MRLGRGKLPALVGAAWLAACLGLAAPAARSQARRPVTAPIPKAAPPAPALPSPLPEDTPDDRPAPYENDLLRLSEIMGSLAYLRALCNAADAAEWRAKMAALIDAEAPTAARRERLAGAYNKGFRGFSLTYRRCTASANAAIERYLVEGKALARAISGRFGG